MNIWRSVFPSLIDGIRPNGSWLQKSLLQTSVNFPTNRRRRPDITDKFTHTDDGDATWIQDYDIDVEDIEDFGSLTREQKFLQMENKRRSALRSKMFLKNKIIERKFFRPLPSSNILSWKAKEQIRFLYSVSPDKRGIESILELFPITEQELRLLLKQKKKVMKDQEEIKRHDKAVLNKWKEILNDTEQLSPSLRQTVENLLYSGQMTHLVNAAGAEDIPELRTPTLEDLARRTPDVTGKLTSLLVKHGSLKLRSSLPSLRIASTGQDRVQLSHEKSVDSPSSPHGGTTTSHRLLLRGIIDKFGSQNRTELQSPAVIQQQQSSDRRYKSEKGLFDSEVGRLKRVGKEYVDEKGEVIFRVP